MTCDRSDFEGFLPYDIFVFPFCSYCRFNLCCVLSQGHTNKKSILRQHKAAANKEAFLLYQKDIKLKAARILRLEAQLEQQAQQHSETLLQLHTQLNVCEAENKTLKDIVNTTGEFFLSCILCWVLYSHYCREHIGLFSEGHVLLISIADVQ